MNECWPLLERCLKGKLGWYGKNLKSTWKTTRPSYISFTTNPTRTGLKKDHASLRSEKLAIYFLRYFLQLLAFLSPFAIKIWTLVIYFMRLHHINFPQSTCSLTKCAWMSLVRASRICSGPVSNSLVRAVRFREVADSKFASLTPNEDFRDFFNSSRLVPGWLFNLDKGCSWFSFTKYLFRILQNL
jgi:hypothetical protein